MKNYLSLLLASVLAAPALLSAADFEGTVTMKLSSARQSPDMTYSIKGTATRVDVTAGQSGRAAMLLDSTKSEMTMVMLDRKMFMTIPLSKPSASADGAGTGATGAPASTIEKTSVTEKILGYDCVKYTAKYKDTVSELWITDQLGSFGGLGGGNPMSGMGRGRGASAGGGVSEGWESALTGMKNAFPLRVISTTGGKESFRMAATAVEKKSLPDSTFTVPEGFQDLSAMMRGGIPGGARPPGGN